MQRIDFLTPFVCILLSKHHHHNRNGQLIGLESASSWLHVVPWGFYKVYIYVYKYIHIFASISTYVYLVTYIYIYVYVYR